MCYLLVLKAKDDHKSTVFQIITEIGTLLQADPRSVMAAIAQDTLGKIGGMFNILIHRHQLNQLTGDGITRTLPSLTILELPEMERSLGKTTQLKISTARINQERKPSTMKATRPDFYSPRFEVDRRVSKENMSVLSRKLFS